MGVLKFETSNTSIHYSLLSLLNKKYLDCKVKLNGIYDWYVEGIKMRNKFQWDKEVEKKATFFNRTIQSQVGGRLWRIYINSFEKLFSNCAPTTNWKIYLHI